MEKLGNFLFEWTLSKRSSVLKSLKALAIIIFFSIYLFNKYSFVSKNQLIFIIPIPIILIILGIVLTQDRNVKVYDKGIIIDKRKEYLWPDFLEWAYSPTVDVKNAEIIINLKATFKEAWGERKNLIEIIPLSEDESLNKKVCAIFESKVGKQSESIKKRYSLP